MPGSVRATHDIDIGEHEVVKRFRSWARGEHRREWRALTLLAEYAPGLAPAPLGHDLDSVPPVVRMSRVPGGPLAAQTVTAAGLDAAAAAISRLHQAIPAGVLGSVPPQPWLAAGATSQLKSSLAATRRTDAADQVTSAALNAAARWLSLATEPDDAGIIPVFGQGDGNLANFLWDGHQVRLVDFEDSGRSDRAFELSVFAEHLSVWHDARLASGAFLDRFELTPAEAGRVLFFRRAFGIFWLLKLLCADRAEDRASTLRMQALRLLALLDSSER